MIPAKQREFAANFKGKTPGRYLILYLTIINIAGGDEIRKAAQEKYGRPKYLPDQMYPTSEEVQMVMYAVDHGVSAERLGRMVPQSYKRANPKMMDVLTKDNAIDLLVQAWDSENEYDEKSVQITERGPGRAVVSRKINPMPCDFFKGAILGTFDMLGVKCKCEEMKCHWKNDDESCVYEVTWE